jgi:hypothetical protein
MGGLWGLERALSVTHGATKNDLRLCDLRGCHLLMAGCGRCGHRAAAGLLEVRHPPCEPARHRYGAQVMAIYGRLARLHELPLHVRVEAWCDRCQRGSPVIKDVWVQKYGRNRTLPELEPRLKCKECGGRGRFSANAVGKK